MSWCVALGTTQAALHAVAGRMRAPELFAWTAVDPGELPPAIQWAMLGPFRGLTRSCLNCAQEPTQLSPAAYAAALRAFHEREPLARWIPLGSLQTSSLDWTCGLLATQEDAQPWTAQASTVIDGCGIVVTLVCSEGSVVDRLQLLVDALAQISPEPDSLTAR